MAKLIGDIAPFDITEIAHPAHEFLAKWIVVRGSRSGVSDTWNLARLLRACRELPGGNRAAGGRQRCPPSDGDWHVNPPREGCLGRISRRDHAVLPLWEGRMPSRCQLRVHADPMFVPPGDGGGRCRVCLCLTCAPHRRATSSGSTFSPP